MQNAQYGIDMCTQYSLYYLSKILSSQFVNLEVISCAHVCSFLYHFPHNFSLSLKIASVLDGNRWHKVAGICESSSKSYLVIKSA